MTTVFTKAEKAKLSELLPNDASWIKGFVGKDDTATSLENAICRLSNTQRQLMLLKAFGDHVGHAAVHQFSDDERTTFSDIRRAIDTLPTVD